MYCRGINKCKFEISKKDENAFTCEFHHPFKNLVLTQDKFMEYGVGLITFSRKSDCIEPSAINYNDLNVVLKHLYNGQFDYLKYEDKLINSVVFSVNGNKSENLTELELYHNISKWCFSRDDVCIVEKVDTGQSLTYFKETENAYNISICLGERKQLINSYPTNELRTTEIIMAFVNGKILKNIKWDTVI